MTRGGARKGTGPKPAAGEPAPVILRTSVTEAQEWWAEHVAGELSLPEWLRSLVDRAISEHTCEECANQGDEVAGPLREDKGLILTVEQAQVMYDALGSYTGYCNDRDRDAPHAVIYDLRERLVRMALSTRS